MAIEVQVEPTDDTPPWRRRRPGRIAIALVVAGLMAMWGYVLFLAFGPGREPPIDRFDDPSFAEAAERVCARALAEIGALPVASALDSAAARADVLDEANAAYAAMLDDLEQLTPLVPAGDQRQTAEEWLADWRTHLGDRRDFARALRTDPNAQLLVSEKAGDGRHITGFIDELALANRMPSCASPTDA